MEKYLESQIEKKKKKKAEVLTKKPTIKNDNVPKVNNSVELIENRLEKEEKKKKNIQKSAKVKLKVVFLI